MHAVVTELISRIISMAAPSPGAGVADAQGPVSNRFARELAARDSVEVLIGYILYDFKPSNPVVSETTPSVDISSSVLLSDSDSDLPNMQSATSSVVQAIAVVVELIRKNNSDYFEPYLFHTLRNRLIQVQQHLAPGAGEDAREQLEAAMREMADKMGVVHLGPVLEVVCERLERFQDYLAKPRSSVRVLVSFSLFCHLTKLIAW
jgi:serine/threonine-protein phosphatase 6 regulatory subunit 3